jgi:hypothetical protein
MRWLSVLVIAVALVAAGCGGGDDESSASDETTIEETLTEDTTTEETTTEESTDEDTDVTAILGDEDCLALAGAGATIAQAFASGSGDTGATEELDALVDKVPDEIRADVQTLAAAIAEYADKLREIGIEGGTPTAEQAQELQAAIASLNNDELTAASARIEAWAKANCEAAAGG